MRHAGAISEARLETHRELDIPDHLCDFAQIPGYKKLHIHRAIASQAGIMTPYFLCHDGVAKDVTRIDGKEYLNFSTYDYLDIMAATASTRRHARPWRNTALRPRPAGSYPGSAHPIASWKKAIADLFGVEDCIAFVSGHATNVWTIAQLFNRSDLVIYDALSHNSIIQGALISGAQRLSFPH